MKIIFATHNQGKLVEMKKMLSGFAVKSAEEAGVFEDVEEDGKTFAENALKKARFVAQKTESWAVADDSGLCIKALGNAPGIMTARWAGEKNSGNLAEFTLEKMKTIPEGRRQAYFESAVALVAPDGREWVFQGRVDGKIALEMKGQALPHLPYDLIFMPEGGERTFAEMPANEKNQMSHRGQAFARLRKHLENFNFIPGLDTTFNHCFE